MLIKETKRLFMDKYSHKIVLVVPAASWFRRGDLNFVLTKLTEFNLSEKQPTWNKNKIKSQEDLEFCFDLYKCLFNLKDYDLRVEQPFISYYTNNPKDVEKLSKIDITRVKYISKPLDSASKLDKGTVIMSRPGYDYKLTLGRTKQSHEAFIEWADNTKGIKLTGSARKELLRNGSWGGAHFYVKDEKTLTMAKMFLGGGISRVDRIVLADK
jgi:predicted transcriptional regulator